MTVQRTWIATKDTYVVDPASGAGRGDYLHVGVTPTDHGSHPSRTLLEFQPDYVVGSARALSVRSAWLRFTTIDGLSWFPQGATPKFWVELVTEAFPEGTVEGGQNLGTNANATTWDNQPSAVTTNRVKYEGNPAHSSRLRIDVKALVQAHLATLIADSTADPVLRFRLIAADTGTGYEESLPARRITLWSRHHADSRPAIEVELNDNNPPRPPTVTPRTIDPGGTNESPYLVNGLTLYLSIVHNDPDVADTMAGAEIQVYTENAEDDDEGNVTAGTLVPGLNNANRQIGHTPASKTWTVSVWPFTPGQRVRYRVRTMDNKYAWGENTGEDHGWTRLQDGWLDFNRPPGAPTGLTTDTTSPTPDFSGNHVSANLGSSVSRVETQVRVTTTRGEELVQNTTTFQPGDESLDTSIYTTRTGTGGQAVPGGTRWTVPYAASGRPLAPGDRAARRHRTRDQYGRAGAFSAWVSWTVGVATAPAAVPDAGVRQDTLTPDIGATYSSEFDLMELRAWSAKTGGQALLDATGAAGVTVDPAATSATVNWADVVGASPLQWGQQVWVERRVRGATDSTFTPWSERELMPINALPDAPVVTIEDAVQQTSGTWIVGTTAPRINTTFTDADAGDSPTARHVTIYEGDTLVHEDIETETFPGYYDVPSGTLEYETEYTVIARHADQSGEYGASSEVFRMFTHQPPDVEVGASDPEPADPTPNIMWTPTFYGGATQAGAVIVIEKETSADVWDEIHRGTVTGTDLIYTVPEDVLPDDTDLRATVTVTDSLGISTILDPSADVYFSSSVAAGEGTSVADFVQSTALPSDTFTRSVSNGWGSATSGGAWTLSGTAANFDVTGTEGTISGTAGLTQYAYLPDVSVRDLTATVKLKTDKLAVGGKLRMGHFLRFMDSSNTYLLDAEARTDLSINVRIIRISAGTTTTLSTVVSGLTHAAGTAYWLKAQATGATPTTLNIRIWAVGDAEPSTWTTTATDSTPALQVPGAIGLRTFPEAGVSNGPVLFTFDDLSTT